MWIGIVFAALLCLATAVCYAEMAKLYPGTGSSYYFAEQSFLNHEKAWQYARLSKFIVGWGSHLYYWIYPGVMVGVMGILCGYLAGTLWPNFMSASNPGPVFMMLVAVVFSFAVAYIACRGVNGSTAVNIAINVIQISALIVFSVMALGYRMNHPPGSVAYQFDSASGDAYTYEFADREADRQRTATDVIVRDAKGVPKPKLDAAGKPVPFKIAYPEHDDKGNFLTHPDGRIGGRHSQLRLGVRAGHGGHSDSGRIRIGDGHGRRGQECRTRRAHRGDHLAAGAGLLLLPVRVLRGELLLEQRVYRCRARPARRRPSAT